MGFALKLKVGNCVVLGLWRTYEYSKPKLHFAALHTCKIELSFGGKPWGVRDNKREHGPTLRGSCKSPFLAKGVQT